MPVPRRDKMSVQDEYWGMMGSLCLSLSCKLAEQLCGLLRKYFSSFINLKIIGKFWKTGKELLLWLCQKRVGKWYNELKLVTNSGKGMEKQMWASFDATSNIFFCKTGLLKETWFHSYNRLVNKGTYRHTLLKHLNGKFWTTCWLWGLPWALIKLVYLWRCAYYMSFFSLLCILWCLLKCQFRLRVFFPQPNLLKKLSLLLPAGSLFPQCYRKLSLWAF